MSGAQGLSSLQRWLVVLVGVVVATVAVATMHSVNRTRNIDLLRSAFPHLAADDAGLAAAEGWLSDSARRRRAQVERAVRRLVAFPPSVATSPTAMDTRAERVHEDFATYLSKRSLSLEDLTATQRDEWFAWYRLSLISAGLPAKDFRGLSLDWIDIVLSLVLGIATSGAAAGALSLPLAQWVSALSAAITRPRVQEAAVSLLLCTPAAGVAWAILRALGSERDSTNFVAEIGAVSVLVLALGACFRFRPFSNFFKASPVRVESPTAPQ